MSLCVASHHIKTWNFVSHYVTLCHHMSLCVKSCHITSHHVRTWHLRVMYNLLSSSVMRCWVISDLDFEEAMSDTGQSWLAEAWKFPDLHQLWDYFTSANCMYGCMFIVHFLKRQRLHSCRKSRLVQEEEVFFRNIVPVFLTFSGTLFLLSWNFQEHRSCVPDIFKNIVPALLTFSRTLFLLSWHFQEHCSCVPDIFRNIVPMFLTFSGTLFQHSWHSSGQK